VRRGCGGGQRTGRQAATARLILGSARAGQAPAALARTQARRGVPAFAALGSSRGPERR